MTFKEKSKKERRDSESYFDQLNDDIKVISITFKNFFFFSAKKFSQIEEDEEEFISQDEEDETNPLLDHPLSDFRFRLQELNQMLNPFPSDPLNLNQFTNNSPFFGNNHQKICNESLLSRSLSNEPCFRKNLNIEGNAFNEQTAKNANEIEYCKSLESHLTPKLEKSNKLSKKTTNETTAFLNNDSGNIRNFTEEKWFSNEKTFCKSFQNEQGFSRNFSSEPTEPFTSRFHSFHKNFSNDSNELPLLHKNSNNESNKNSNLESNEMLNPEKISNSMFKASSSDLEYGCEIFQTKIIKENKNVLQCMMK